MTGAMYSAIAGLKTHMSKLNVIGNNIANANTYGYKSARTVFSESIYSTVHNGANSSISMGGINPAQLGYGCSISSIDLDMGTQSYVPTGRGQDVMIFGDGFFLVGKKPEAYKVDDDTYMLQETDPKSLMLTRVGNFKIDDDGYLTDGNGYVVYGFATVAGVYDDATKTVIPSEEAGIADKDAPALSTQLVPLRLPLAAKKPADPTTGIPEGTPIFPGLTASDNELADPDGLYNLYDVGGAQDSLTTGKTIPVGPEALQIDALSGRVSFVHETGDQYVVGYIPLAQVTNVNGLTHMTGPYFMALDGAGQCSVVSINNSMDGRYMNNSTGEDAKRIFSAGGTTCMTGGLESSGTDIATEFSEMITTQRGYQANTRIVTVTDSMLEELVNMKR